MVYAEDISKTINAVYMNVKLVVDGIQIEPKDANGNYVEPFIYNGTTYLPVRAVGEAFGKDVSWDGNTATVYIGGEVEKPAKEIYLFEKPYIECKNANEFEFGKQSYSTPKINNYISVNISPFHCDDRENLSNGRYKANNYIVYPLNGVAKKLKGTFVAPRGAATSPEVQINFYNEDGKLLYQSPILNGAINPIDFEFDINNSLSLKIEFVVANAVSSSGTNTYVGIENLAIVTTDY